MIALLLGELMLCGPRAGFAQAQPEAARASLTTKISEEASVCVSPDELRERVSARLGYDPFSETPDAPTSEPLDVVVRVDANGQTYQATISTSRGGAAASERERVLESDQCQDLIDATVFAMALAIDPVRSMKPAPLNNVAREPLLASVARARQAAQNAASIEAAKRTRIASTAMASREATRIARANQPREPTGASDVGKFSRSLPPLAIQLVGSTGARIAEMPTAAADVGTGFEVERLHRQRLSLGVRSTLPARYETVHGGSITLSTQRADVEVCQLFINGLLATCAMASAGTYSGSGRGFASDFTKRAGLLGLGGSAKAGWMFTDRFGVRVSVDGARMLSRASWRVGDDVLHQTPAWSASTQAQVLYRWRL